MDEKTAILKRILLTFPEHPAEFQRYGRADGAGGKGTRTCVCQVPGDEVLYSGSRRGPGSKASRAGDRAGSGQWCGISAKEAHDVMIRTLRRMFPTLENLQIGFVTKDV